MQKFLFLCLFSLVTVFSMAQMPGGGQPRTGGRPGGAGMNMGHFYGKIVDAKTSKGVDAASVQLIMTKFDTVTKKQRDTIVSGMLTRPNGDFTLENLPVFGNYRLSITAIGYKPIEQKVAFQLTRRPGAGMEQMLSAVDKDLGNIKMEPDAQVLATVTVSASKPMVQMGIDRKIFNVEKNLSSVGGTAVDVMRNVPSVQVDIDGNVTLRNNAPQIYVDGRPSTLTLEQIPSDAIQSVEIITNPSAKYDASGGTAGILNIVLKKNRKAGYSGNVRAGIDSRAKPNIGADINAREGKFNVFASVNYNQRKSISNGNTERLTYGKEYDTYLQQTDKNVMNGNFAFTRLGLDYFIDNRNTITFGANLARGKFRPKATSDINVDTIFSNKTTSSLSQRTSNSDNEFKNLGTTLSYKHLFTKPGKEITADINYNRSRNINHNLVETDIYREIGGPVSGEFNQQLEGGGKNRFFIAQTDFVNPLSDMSKLEMGARISVRKNGSTNQIFQNTPPSPDYIYKPQLSSNFTNQEKIYAAYTTYSNAIKNFGYMVGLRVEGSRYDGVMNSTTPALKDTTSSYGNSFPISLFPSIFLSQKLKDDQEVQLNFSRRINRPNFFQLFPFTDYSDSLNLSRGNPALNPEFTSSFELSYQKIFPGNNSLLISGYYKYTNDLITRIFVNEVNPVDITDTLIVNTYTNANSSYVTGLEITSRNTLTKWWELTSNLNLFTSKIDIEQEGVQPQDPFFSWFAKINNSFRLPKNFTVQLSGDYQSKTVLPPGGSGGGGGGFGGGGGRGGGGGFFGMTQSSAQGYVRPNYGVDAAVRYEFLKDKVASVTLSMNDILRTRRSDVHSESPFFVQDAFRRRDAQVLRLSFNYRFGKFDASLLKRRNNRTNTEGMQDAQM